MKKLIFLLMGFMLIPVSIYASEKVAGDPAAGKVLYEANCERCHGKTGEGNGPDSLNMTPAPRNFTTKIFKFKTSSYKESIPFDEDIYQVISDGLPGSAMPSFKGSISKEERRHVVAYVKQLANISGEAKEKIDYSGWVPPTSDKKALKKVKKLFSSRCSACHGENGRGNTTMELEDEWGGFIWPRNLTKHYSFRIGNAPIEIFQRISAGIPGTPMPSFADPEAGEDHLKQDELWMMANYVNSLEDRNRVFNQKAGKVVQAWYTETLPEDIEDMEPWVFAKPLVFGLSPKTAPGEKALNSLTDVVTVRALHDGTDVAILMEWDDFTMTTEDGDAVVGGDWDAQNDAVAVYMPAGTVSEDTSKAFFGLGDEDTPVIVWYLDANGGKKNFTFKGSENFDDSNASESSVIMEAQYNSGRWTALMRRPLKSAVAGDAKLEEGKSTPMAISVWDGSNNEKGLTHTYTNWYWLNVLEKGKGGIL